MVLVLELARAAADDAAKHMTRILIVIIGLPKSGSVIIPVDQLTTGDTVR